MYIKNRPFEVAGCKTSFENDRRIVILDMQDDAGLQMQLRVPESLMAAMTGQFLRERLFGLH